jgi:hypothetical protein
MLAFIRNLSEFRHFIVPVSVVEDKKKSVQKLASCMIGEDGFAEVKKFSAERKAKTLARTAASCGNRPVAGWKIMGRCLTEKNISNDFNFVRGNQ